MPPTARPSRWSSCRLAEKPRVSRPATLQAEATATEAAPRTGRAAQVRASGRAGVLDVRGTPSTPHPARSPMRQVASVRASRTLIELATSSSASSGCWRRSVAGHRRACSPSKDAAQRRPPTKLQLKHRRRQFCVRGASWPEDNDGFLPSQARRPPVNVLSLWTSKILRTYSYRRTSTGVLHAGQSGSDIGAKCVRRWSAIDDPYGRNIGAVSTSARSTHYVERAPRSTCGVAATVAEPPTDGLAGHGERQRQGESGTCATAP